MDIDGFYPSKCKRLLDMVTSMHRTVSKASSQRLPVKGFQSRGIFMQTKGLGRDL